MAFEPTPLQQNIVDFYESILSCSSTALQRASDRRHGDLTLSRPSATVDIHMPDVFLCSDTFYTRASRIRSDVTAQE